MSQAETLKSESEKYEALGKQVVIVPRTKMGFADLYIADKGLSLRDYVSYIVMSEAERQLRGNKNPEKPDGYKFVRRFSIPRS